MRIVLLGGTRFIGRAVALELESARHDLLLVHRGRHEPRDGAVVATHLHAHRAELAARRDELRRFGPDAVVDLSAMTGAEARIALEALDGDLRRVAISSADVYRAFASVWAGTVTDAVPLTETSAVRTRPSPDRDYVPEGWDYDPRQQEKLDVEAAYLAHGAAVCRLPMVYGERDYKRREDFILRRVRAGRRRIPFGAGSWLWSRGYAPELARAIRMALENDRAAGESFNLCEPECASIRHWAQEILDAAESPAELVKVPDTELPADLEITAAIDQHWLLDPGKAGADLGWVHAPWRECVRRSVRWHLAHPPGPDRADFAADDRALSRASSDA